MDQKHNHRPNLNEGEIYAGIILGETPEQDYHLILLPGEAESVDWQASMDWAGSIGGELPTRREQSLLLANAKKHFNPAWYWSNTQHASDSNFAWGQVFNTGSQYNIIKGSEGRARAVRRLPI